MIGLPCGVLHIYIGFLNGKNNKPAVYDVAFIYDSVSMFQCRAVYPETDLAIVDPRRA